MSGQNVYTIKQLTELAKQQEYKFACLLDNTGKKINNYNTHQTALSKQMVTIENRLKNPSLPDGIYFVGMCQKYGRGQIVDKYPVLKGKAPENGIINYAVVQSPQPVSEHVLTYESALQMQREISKLETENMFLANTNKLQAEKIAELQKELDHAEDSLSELETNKTTGLADFGGKVGDWLKDIGPMLSPLADRYFDYKNKQLDIVSKKLDLENGAPRKKVEPKKLKVGSPEFLDYVRKVHAAGNVEELDKCLDALEKHFPEQYEDIGDELGLFEEEEEEEETEGGKKK